MTNSAVLQARDVPAGGGTVYAVEAGDREGPPVVFLHGYPESWMTWEPVLELAAADGARAIALDLPGIGDSVTAATSGRKTDIAGVIHEALAELGVERPTIVGHDAGGMVAYAYLRQYGDEIAGASIIGVAIPGVDPWDHVLAIPQLWHFAFHSVPDLPERLVAGKERGYFDFFWNTNSANPDAIAPELREANTDAYRTPEALTAGFNLYRAFEDDALDNRATAFIQPQSTPLLYVRGSEDRGDPQPYVDGFHAAGLTDVRVGIAAGAGHYVPTEAPEATWALLREFIDIGAPTSVTAP